MNFILVFASLTSAEMAAVVIHRRRTSLVKKYRLKDRVLSPTSVRHDGSEVVGLN